MTAKLLYTIMVIFVTLEVQAQQNDSSLLSDSNTIRLSDIKKKFINVGDSIFLNIINGVCKNTNAEFFRMAKVFSDKNSNGQIENPEFLKMHGNILYNFSYRSYIDTPFAQNDLMQHQVQTTLNFLLKDRYPVKVTLSNRSSNSVYFKNFTDVNVQFNQTQLMNNLKQDLINKIPTTVNTGYLAGIESKIKISRQELMVLQSWLNNPARLQEIVEEKEQWLMAETNVMPEYSGFGLQTPAVLVNKPQQALIKKIQKQLEKNYKKSIDSLSDRSKIDSSVHARYGDKKKAYEKFRDSSVLKKYNEHKERYEEIRDSSVLKKYNKVKGQYDKMQDSIQRMEAKAKHLKKKLQDTIAVLKKEINQMKSADSLYAFVKRNNIPKDFTNKAQKILLSVKEVGIGRSWLDYSELTVKNISLGGVHLEMNPGRFYFAFAAGKVNYRFRDFIYKNNIKQPPQKLYALRVGLGNKEKNNVIATIYSGDKALLNYSTIDLQPTQKIMGISLEAKLVINQNNYLIAEFAKSSYISNGILRPTSSDLIRKVFDLNTHSNEAYSIKFFSQNPSTGTKITGWYRKMGQNFQSFNLSPVNVNQDAWMIKIGQVFFKKRLLLDASVKKNDFSSPVATTTFNSQAIFKSIQLTLRIPKYPFLSIGYYPSSQLAVSSGNVLTESQYNTLNGVVSHNYEISDLSMNTNILYTKFYNNGSDTGFIYFNASSITVNQSIFLHRLNLQSSMAVTTQKDINLFTLEQQLSYQINQSLSVTGALKWNRLNHRESLFGSMLGVNWSIKRLGIIQLNYDKTYLPGNSRLLMPVDIGRLSFYREF